MNGEPVLTGAGVVDALAALLVFVGKVSGLFTLSTADAAGIAGAVVVLVSAVAVFVRRKVTPTTKLPNSSTAPAGAAPPAPAAGSTTTTTPPAGSGVFGSSS